MDSTVKLRFRVACADTSGAMVSFQRTIGIGNCCASFANVMPLDVVTLRNKGRCTAYTRAYWEKRPIERFTAALYRNLGTSLSAIFERLTLWCNCRFLLSTTTHVFACHNPRYMHGRLVCTSCDSTFSVSGSAYSYPEQITKEWMKKVINRHSDHESLHDCKCFFSALVL